MKVKALRLSKNTVEFIDIPVPLYHNLQMTFAIGINIYVH